MDTFSCILCLASSWIFALVLKSIITKAHRSTARKLPPGPKPFPIIGNLLELGVKPHKSLNNLSKIHGPIMTLKLGQVTTIVITSATMAKEILQNHDISFANRTIPDSVTAHQHHQYSMVWLPVSTTWRTIKKISDSHIFNTAKLDANQHLRQKKVQELIRYVEVACREGKAVDIAQAAFNTTINVLSNTFFSVDLADPSCDTSRHFKEVVCSIMEDAGRPNVTDFFPVLRKIDLQGVRRRMTKSFGKMLDLFDRMIDERLKLREVRGYAENKDILDTLLNILEDKSKEIHREHVKHMFMDLLVAGTDTTSSTLEWAMAELLRKLKILRKAKVELEQVIGKGKMVKESDITKLPYLQAIVKETFRLHPAVPFLVPRRAVEDIELGGFTVPEGAQVLVNVWAIRRDASTWEHPNSFVPERFMGSDVDVKGTNFELIPFGAGRRICTGFPLAVRMLPLMLGSLVKCFDWKLEDGVMPENIDMEDKYGISLHKAQPLRIIPIAT